MVLNFLFRLKRKLTAIFLSISLKLKLIEWNQLHGERISVDKTINIGRFFSLIFDASSSKIIIGSNVQFRDYCQLRSGMNGQLKIGNRVFFNNFCSITCFHAITIGDDCQFGEGVKFYDHNHQYRATGKLINEQGYSTGSITIGNNCWIGSDVVILKDVTIGNNVIIGAGCIIHKSVESDSVIINKQQLLHLQKQD